VFISNYHIIVVFKCSEVSQTNLDVALCQMKRVNYFARIKDTKYCRFTFLFLGETPTYHMSQTYTVCSDYIYFRI